MKLGWISIVREQKKGLAVHLFEGDEAQMRKEAAELELEIVSFAPISSGEISKDAEALFKALSNLPKVQCEFVELLEYVATVALNLRPQT